MESPAVLPDSAPPSHQATAGAGWWAVCLCAGWCGTCRDYRPLFDALAREHPAMRFEWVDIEDQADIAGDLDVETFPTLLIADGRQALFLGPLLPQAPVLARLLASLQGAGGPGAAAPRASGGEAQALFVRVRAALG